MYELVSFLISVITLGVHSRAPVERAPPGHRVRPPAQQGGSRAAAQGGFYFFTNRTTISTMDARRCVAIVGEA